MASLQCAAQGTLWCQGGRRVWEGIRFTFAVYPTFLVTTFENRERNTVSKLTLLSRYLHLTLSLWLLKSLCPICTIFDSCDVLNSIWRSIYKVGREKNKNLFYKFSQILFLLSHGPFLYPCPTPPVHCSPFRRTVH